MTALRRSRDQRLLQLAGLPAEPYFARTEPLSTREAEVIDLIRHGLTNREIAQTLKISEATAKVHVQHILSKLGARTRTEAARLYTGDATAADVATDSHA